MLAVASQFGMTPSARVRLGAGRLRTITAVEVRWLAEMKARR